MKQDLGLMPSVESFISLRWDSGATGRLSEQEFP